MMSALLDLIERLTQSDACATDACEECFWVRCKCACHDQEEFYVVMPLDRAMFDGS